MSKVLNTDKLVVGYGNTVVVEGVNIAIEPGSITTIIGPNGSGKSTILKTILGQIKPLEGAVFIEGLNSLSLDRNAKAKMISMVITNRPRTELMTCFDVVATARYPYTGRFGLLADKDINAINDALDFVGAKDLSDNDFSCLSDGQKQRIMIARAIAQNPKILILDEPTSFLDIKYKLDILGCIKKLVKINNVAVIMSLHELELARSISDTVIAVENNKIGRVGKVEEIFSDGYIPRLYNIDPKNFDEKNGVIIMPEWS